MKKLITGIAVFVSALILVVFFGCSVFQDVVTPCQIDKGAKIYVGEDPNDPPNLLPFRLPWDTVLDSKRVYKKMCFLHDMKQQKLNRLKEDDNVLFAFLEDSHLGHFGEAQEFQQTVFSPSGPIGALLPTIFGGTLGALLIPRPGEKKKIADAKEEGRKEANHET